MIKLPHIYKTTGQLSFHTTHHQIFIIVLLDMSEIKNNLYLCYFLLNKSGEFKFFLFGKKSMGFNGME
jgi:hypothetical protein